MLLLRPKAHPREVEARVEQVAARAVAAVAKEYVHAVRAQGVTVDEDEEEGAVGERPHPHVARPPLVAPPSDGRDLVRRAAAGGLRARWPLLRSAPRARLPTWDAMTQSGSALTLSSSGFVTRASCSRHRSLAHRARLSLTTASTHLLWAELERVRREEHGGRQSRVEEHLRAVLACSRGRAA